MSEKRPANMCSPQARYITSNSGGSWFNTAFSYQAVYKRETFLGEYIEPKDLTPAAAKRQGQAEGSYAKAIADSNFLKDFMVELISDFFSMDWLRGKDVEKVRAWSEVSALQCSAPTIKPRSLICVA